MSAEVGIAGVSRSGRLRKKSAKLIENELTGTGEVVNGTPKTTKSPAIPGTPSSLVSTDPDQAKPLKKKLKIKLSMGEIVPEDDDEVINEDGRNLVAPVTGIVPPLKIKLFSPLSKPLDTSINQVKKKEKLHPLKKENDTAANKLFKQITAGVATIETPKRKNMKKNNVKITPTIMENVNFDCDDDDEESASLVIADANESVAAAKALSIAVAQAKKIKNPKTPKTSIEKREEKKAKQKQKTGTKPLPQDKDKKRRAPLVTAYTLWSRENRTKIQRACPDLDFSSVSKKLGEIWQALPNKEKMQWKKRAQKMSGKTSQGIISTGTTRNIITPSQKAISTLSLTSPLKMSEDYSKYSQSLNEDIKPIGTSPLDVAAHLKLLGESLSIIGQRLTEHSGQIAVSGTLSVLLDSTLCALGPLMCLTSLTEQTDGIDKETHEKTMDNIAFIMPGI